MEVTMMSSYTSLRVSLLVVVDIMSTRRLRKVMASS